MARDENVRIFQDTEKRVKEDPGLQEAVKQLCGRTGADPGDDGSHGPDAGACTES